MTSHESTQARIVLGGGINSQGELSDVSRERIAYAVAEYHHDSLPLIVSGRWSLLAQDHPPRTEAEALAEYALKEGVASSDLLVESSSMETMGNAYYSSTEFVLPLKFKKVRVITSFFHVARAAYAFNKVLGDACEVVVSHPPHESFSDEEFHQLEEREKKILDFFKSLFDPIADGDLSAIHDSLFTLPGYHSKPHYTRDELLKIIASSSQIGNTYHTK